MYRIIWLLYTYRKNLILSDVIEVRKVPIECSPDDTTTELNKQEKSKEQNETKYWCAERRLSQAMVPGSRLVKVELSKKIWDKTIGGKE
mmetsp:Transcript_9220/g.12815  ORF Transcript_9220/g.12815 Transcript_9220/m.12815 type:complete len:89 (+) Transcript_9220:216-482(+)